MGNNFDKIKQFWEEAGEKKLDKDGLKPTARDPWMQRINEYHVSRLLSESNKVLDIGCGEGTSSAIFFDKCEELIGVDYSQSLIEQAQTKVQYGLSFQVGDVLDLKDNFEANTFDKIVSIRCLINLPAKEMQYQALDNLLHVLKPRGILLFSEGYQLGWDMLNVYRKRNGLPSIHVVEYNKLFENLELESYFRLNGEIEDYIGFGDYLYGSRIIHPILTDGEVRHDSDINKQFALVHMNSNCWQKFDDCSYAGIYVVRKN